MRSLSYEQSQGKCLALKAPSAPDRRNSATGCSQRAIIVHGPTAVNANIHRCPHQRTEESQDATAVVRETSRYLLHALLRLTAPAHPLLFPQSATETCLSATTVPRTRNQNATTPRRNDTRSRLTMLPRVTGPLRHTQPRRHPSSYQTCCPARVAPQAILRPTQVRRAVTSLRASSVLNLKSANTFHPTRPSSTEKTPT